ncbi:unnamed protein product [Bursaphelenchus xylophilus]|uniref:(pine wood nematode) hypothetical protein n=1 Tax=Bursaphelenchus xylophilus TaxID=6326 RepID=A0A1I7RMJ2_BURXY|nr:unnamed protein product [Bursaphelenchus xylophilus]CAG9118547.1 unnamed protein product [Bursaphelenchus xylophilus]
MMKLALAILAVLAASVQAAKYYDDSAKAALTIGTEESKSLDFKFQADHSDIFVFGPACEKADSCAKEAHATFDPVKNNGTVGSQDLHFNGVVVDEYSGITVQLDKAVSTHKILVATKPIDPKKTVSFDSDAYFGLRIHRDDTAFSSLVDGQEEGKKFLLIIPKDPKNSKSEGQVVVGADDNKACAEFSLQDTQVFSNQSSWAVQINITYSGKSGLVNVAPAFTEKLLINDRIKAEIFGSGELSADEYKNATDLVIKHGKVEIKIPKEQLFVEKDKKYVLNADPTGTHDDFQLGLNNNVLKNYCIKLVKETEKYTIGLSDRKNSVGLVSASLGLLMGMLAVVRL